MKSSVNQRCFKRYEIKLVATLVVNNTQFIQCVIRDFCSEGLFLQPLKQNIIDNLKPQQKKRILFSVQCDDDTKDFILDAKLVHIREHGIGVVFERNSDDVFSALKAEANNSLDIGPIKPENHTSNLLKLKALQPELAIQLRSTIHSIIRDFYQRINEQSQDTVSEFEDLPCKSTFKEVIFNLEVNKNELVEGFCNTVQNLCFVILISPEQVQNKESTSSLIEKNDFDDWLNLLEIVRNLESIFDSQLDQLQKKMADIVGVKKTEIINPVCPEKLCDSFRDVLANIEDSSWVRDILYDIFEQSLLEFLPGLYDKIDYIVRQHGTSERIRSEDLIISESLGQDSCSSSRRRNGRIAGYETVSTTQKTDKKTSQNSDIITSSLLSKTDGQTITSADTDQGSEYQQAEDTLDSSFSPLSKLGDKPTLVSDQCTKTEDNVFVPVSEYSADEIKLAMKHLQRKAINGRTLYFKPQILKIELQQTLKAFSSTQKQLSNIDKNNLEVHECLFDILFNEMLLSRKIKSYLQQLYLPIMGQAMQDSDFIENSSHPVRNIINHLFWLDFVVKDNNKLKNIQLIESLESWVQNISDESLNNAAIFTEVEQKLNEITQSVSQSVNNKIQRVVEYNEGKKKLENARLFVQEEFKRRSLADKKIPKIIVTLLDAGWHHLLVLSRLEDDNHAFQSYVRIINNLNGWLTGQEEASKEQIETTLEFIENKLKLVCTNALLQNEIITELSDLFSIIPGVYAMQMVRMEQAEDTHKVSKVRRGIDEVDLLLVGEWLSVFINQIYQPLKLVWICDHQNEYVLVDRGGRKKIQLQRNELLELIKQGSAKRIESLDIPVMDRAITLMLQTMHKKLVFNVTHDPVTQLLNPDRFIMQLKQNLLKFDHIPYLLCNIEITDYEIISNSCGLDGINALCRQLADLMKSHLHEQAILARLNDKIFSILVKNCTFNKAEMITNGLLSKLISSPFIWMGTSYTIAVNVGVIPLCSNSNYDINSVLQEAEVQTLAAKQAGSNCIRIYQGQDGVFKIQPNVSDVTDQVIEDFAEKNLLLRCQKISSLDPNKNRLPQYEIFLGTKDNKGNIISPDDFFLAVECSKQQLEIDRWVVLTVIDWIDQHQHTFETLAGFSINLSDQSINSEAFLGFLDNTLKNSILPLHKITFQINESVAIDNFLFVQQFIRQIKQFKCKFSLVDLGSGRLSHTYLQKLDIDYLKIDSAFVKDIHTNSNDLAIVKSMNKIAHTLGLETIAENVEDEKIHSLLNEVGVDHALGSEIQMPMLLADLA